MKQLALVAYRASTDVVGKASLLVVTVVAARVLPRHAFGVFGVGSTVGWLLGVVSDGGIQLHVARTIARDSGQAAAIVRRWFRVRATAAAVAFAIAAAIVTAAARGTTRVALLLLIACYLLSAITEFFFYVFRGFGRTDIESTIVVLHRALMLAASIAVLTIRPSLPALAGALLICAFAALIAAGRAVTQLTSAVRRVAPSADPTAARDRFARDVLPIGAGIILSAIYFRIDVLLVEWWRGAEAVAVYNAVFRLIEAARLVPAAALAVVLPLLCRAGDERPLARVAASMSAFGIGTAAVLWTAAGWLVPLLYGPSYASGIAAFRVLALAFPLMCLNYVLSHQLIGWDAQHAFALTCAVSLIANLLLNAVLIPAWSIEGAAWATLGTELVVTAGCGAALAAGRRVPRALVPVT